MELNENRDLEPVIDITPEPESIEAEPIAAEPIEAEPMEVLAAEEEPVAAEPEPESAYHGAGVGQQERFGPSPWDIPVTPDPIPEPVPEPQPEPQPSWEPPRERIYQPQPEAQPRKKKKAGKTGKRILAAVLALAVLGGACSLTAWSVNSRWEDRMTELQVQVDNELARLQAELDAVAEIQSGTGVSGSPMSSSDGLSPSQVYAMNVNSVVAISNQTTTNVWGQVSETASSGSGFVLSEDGYIVSNYHVVEGATRLTVITYMGDEYEATLVGYDEMNDVSILKVDATGLDPVTIGSSDELIVGDQVVAIGNPLGELTSSLTVGYISAKDRTINTDGSLINMMQTDAAINPGNSGGPLFNMKGEVIGITTAKYSGSTTSGASIEGIGFAIPIDDVMSMADDLMTHGYLTNQAYLGVSVMDLDSSTASMYSLPTGSYVQSVVAGGCAETAGIQPKDIIIAVGDYAVEGNSTLQVALRKFKAGDTTTITVWRSGAELELTITFDERPQDPTADQEQSQSQGEMPSSGSYEDWYNYFYPFFGGRNG